MGFPDTAEAPRLSTLRMRRKESHSKLEKKKKRREPELRPSPQRLPAPKHLGEVVSQVPQSRITEITTTVGEGDPRCISSSPQNLAGSCSSLRSHANYVAPQKTVCSVQHVGQRKPALVGSDWKIKLPAVSGWAARQRQDLQARGQREEGGFRIAVPGKE